MPVVPQDADEAAIANVDGRGMPVPEMSLDGAPLDAIAPRFALTRPRSPGGRSGSSAVCAEDSESEADPDRRRPTIDRTARQRPAEPASQNVVRDFRHLTEIDGSVLAVAVAERLAGGRAERRLDLVRRVRDAALGAGRAGLGVADVLVALNDARRAPDL